MQERDEYGEGTAEGNVAVWRLERGGSGEIDGTLREPRVAIVGGEGWCIGRLGALEAGEEEPRRKSGGFRSRFGRFRHRTSILGESDKLEVNEVVEVPSMRQVWGAFLFFSFEIGKKKKKKLLLAQRSVF